MQHLNRNSQQQQSTKESSNVIVIQDAQKIPAKPTNETKTRVATLDVFRGLTIAVMILVDDAGGEWPQINHSPWNGCTLADFVMPFFLFIVGVAIALRFKRITEMAPAIKKVIVRTLKLLFWGILLQGGYSHAPDDLSYGVNMKRIRWCGILQRIALSYLVVSLVEIITAKARPTNLPSERFAIFKLYIWHWLVGLCVFLIYFAITYGLYVPDWHFVVHDEDSPDVGKSFTVKCGVRGHLGPPCNAVGYVDRQVWGINHLYRYPEWTRSKYCTESSPGEGPLRKNSPAWCLAPFEPEGLLSSISAIMSTIIGVHVVCEMLDKAVRTICQERSCICIPAWPAERDTWTEMLMRCLKTKDKEDRGVTAPASEALEKYIAQSGVCKATEEYSSVPLILPRVAEIVINIILTAWFRIDGFSSSLVARRVIRDYVVDSRGTGIAANVFLKKCEVYSNAENTNVCQVLTFRGNLLNFRTFSFIIGGVNLMCSISWGVLIAIPGNWYDTLSMPPSKARIVILIAAIGIALLMDCLQFYLYHSEAIDELHGFDLHSRKKLYNILLWLVMILEIVCIIVGSAVVGTLGIKVFGKWTYSAIQVLVWVKWAFGSYFLGTYSYDEEKPLAPWASDMSAGHGLMCASAFWLNAVLAGVRGQWKYSQS